MSMRWEKMWVTSLKCPIFSGFCKNCGYKACCAEAHVQAMDMGSI